MEFLLAHWSDVSVGTVVRLDDGEAVEVDGVDRGPVLSSGAPGQMRVTLIDGRVLSVWPTSEVHVAVAS